MKTEISNNVMEEIKQVSRLMAGNFMAMPELREHKDKIELENLLTERFEKVAVQMIKYQFLTQK